MDSLMLIYYEWKPSRTSRIIFHDEMISPEPRCFRPERYLDENGILKMRIHLQLHLDMERGQNHIDYVLQVCNFYRICPGLYLAENPLFLVITTILYVFNILEAKDGNHSVRRVQWVYHQSHCGGDIPDP